MDHFEAVSQMLGINRGQLQYRAAHARGTEDRNTVREVHETPDITAIAANVDYSNRHALAQNIVDVDGDAEDGRDCSGIARTVNAMKAPKLSESGLGNKEKGDREPDGNPDKSKQEGADGQPDIINAKGAEEDEDCDDDGEDIDAKAKAVKKVFMLRHGLEARMMLRGHVREGDWTDEDWPLRKALESMCENDAEWDAGRAAHARMGGSAGGYDNVTRVFG